MLQRVCIGLTLAMVLFFPRFLPGAAAPEGARPVNRLAKEKSPYLLQHAHNPIDWYPWGEEAFEKAKRENKPIFLSVGYSTCHWCHVMERESFEDAAVAKLINEGFVPVKVDREERPDVDRIYMTFVQAATGRGGWPMTVFLTPDRKPFYGGTYYPPEERHGLPGIKTVLTKVREAWDTQHDDLVKQADSLTQAVEQIARVKPAEGDAAKLDGTAIDDCYKALAKTFDEQYGGFGSAPKFPEPVNFNFLLRYHDRTRDEKPKELVLQSLRKIAAGGIRDHLGGGFHRYSTDRRWFLPHFEKMLYDQAQLASCYVDAYLVSGDVFFADVARDTLDYVLRDLTGEGGQFYSAEDADSAGDPAKPEEKSEGAFYIWRAAEIEKLLGAETAAVFNFHYGVATGGNVPAAQDPHKEFPGVNVLAAVHTPEETGTKFGKSAEQVGEVLASSRQKLLDARSKRPRPHRDDKTITAWNGLAISAFARAGVVLNEPRYTQAAAKAASFIESKLYEPTSRQLKRIYRDGPSGVTGFLDDHAFMVQGLLDLYESTLDVRWLKWAVDLQARQDELFEEKEEGGYFTTSGADASILHRVKDDQEGVEPAGNSVAALNLSRLGQILDDPALADRAAKVLRAFSGRVREHPSSMPQMLVAADFHGSKPVQIVIAGDPTSPEVAAMLREVHRAYRPNRIILGADGGAGQAFLAGHAEFIRDMKPLNGKATAYVCRDYACEQPTADLDVLRTQLQR